MLAIIRVLEDGHSRHLCDLDLMKFTKEQVQDRMRERGIRDEAFYICGFKDWQLDRILSLDEAYLLKRCLLELYDGDDYLIRFMLREGRSASQICSIHYRFYSKDELAVMNHLLKHTEVDGLLATFQQSHTWANFVMSYHHAGYLLVTPKGYYLAGDYFS